MKIGFVASSGGHWEEIMCLKEIADEYESFYITENGGQALDSNKKDIYVFPQINRYERKFFIHFFKLFANAHKILKKEKPDLIITTGALISFPFCILVKVRGGKLIYIESFARINNGSLMGRIAYYFADLFLVQWESLLDVYPNAKYVGGIF